MFTCNQCGTVYTRKDNLVRHRKNSCRRTINLGASTATIPSKAVTNDKPCAKRQKLETEDNVKLAAKLIPMHCNTCNIDVPRSSYAGHCKSLAHIARLCHYVDNGVELVKSAYKNRIAVFRDSAIRHHISYSEFFDEVADKIKCVIQDEVVNHKGIKLNLELFGNFVHQTQDLTEIKSFNTANKIVMEASDLNSIYDDFVGKIESKGTEFQERDSGWALEKILFVEVNINKYKPMRVSSYIKLPRMVELKKAFVKKAEC